MRDCHSQHTASIEALDRPQKYAWAPASGATWTSWLSVSRAEGWFLGAAIAVALAERAAWALLRPGHASGGEAHNIAVAIASGRGFADAFRPGQGPTDHLLPTMPVFAGGVYWLLGIDTPAAEVVLWSASVGLGITSYLFYYWAFGRLGVSVGARMAVFWFLCAAPLFVQLEASNFRTWDGALAACMCAVFFNALLATRDLPSVSTKRIVVLSAFAAAVFFTTPPLGIGAFAAAGLFCFANLGWRAFAKAVLASCAALTLLLGAWGLRNEMAMGKFMPLRDNAGLELALSQYDGALASADGVRRRERRFFELHPLGPAYAELKAVGEVRYSQKLGVETKQWMREHPAQVARIMAMHLGQIVTPPPWVFRVWQTGNIAAVQSLLASFIGILGCLGLAAGLFFRPKEWCYPALLIAGPVLPFILFQPMPRYLYLIDVPLAFCGTGLLLLGVRVRRSTHCTTGRTAELPAARDIIGALKGTAAP